MSFRTYFWDIPQNEQDRSLVAFLGFYSLSLEPPFLLIGRRRGSWDDLVENAVRTRLFGREEVVALGVLLNLGRLLPGGCSVSLRSSSTQRFWRGSRCPLPDLGSRRAAGES